MIERGSLVTQKGSDSELYKVEEVVDRDRHLVKIRSVLTDATKDVDVGDLTHVTFSDISKAHEDVKGCASEVDNYASDDTTTQKQYALAQGRFNILKKFRDGEVTTKEEICAELNISGRTFYTLLKKFDGHVGISSMVVSFKGRNMGCVLHVNASGIVKMKEDVKGRD